MTGLLAFPCHGGALCLSRFLFAPFLSSCSLSSLSVFFFFVHWLHPTRSPVVAVLCTPPLCVSAHPPATKTCLSSLLGSGWRGGIWCSSHFPHLPHAMDKFLTPVNIGLGLIIAYLLKKLLTPAPPAPAPRKAAPLELPQRDFTLEELAKYNGTNVSEEHNGAKPIYLALNGVVFDVSARPDFYGPGSGYAVFAGRDASRGLACMDLAPRPVEWDELDDLTAEQKQTLREWCTSFESKYPVRGRLVKSKN
eukprot:m.291410 g.291410  ORF g.291410 m.291410 type:complete len:250 (-) comp12467_c0_seq1:1183-1932(-)